MYIDINDPSDFVEQCKKLELTSDDILLICLARQTEPKLDRILELLSKTTIRFFGGIFPALIDGVNVRENGAVVQIHKLAENLSWAQIDGDDVVWRNPLPDVRDALVKPTCLVLADFSCVAVSSLLEDLFNRHGNKVNYFGGGAGTGARLPSPVLFSDEGRYTGVALIAYIASKAEVRLRHGWSRNSEPVIATKTQGNVIQELNWEPATVVYRKIVGDQVANSLGRKEDVPEAKRFPFGIAREDLEDVIRDPLLATEQNELVVLSEVREHSVMHIMKADSNKLIASAEQLGKDFAEAKHGDLCLLFDCFSRTKILADEFPEELEAFRSGLYEWVPDCRIEGVLALGEIASDGNRLPEFHNKTIAAGLKTIAAGLFHAGG